MSDEKPFFSAVLRPNCSLNNQGFIVLMSLVSAICLILGIFFLLIGAWPVFGFFGLDILMLYLAFRLNYRAAKRYELVEICDDRLTVTTGWDGVATDLKAFDPYWVRLQLSKSERAVGPLHLTSHGQKLEIASFLGPDERCDFADALGSALQNYRTV